MNAKAAIDRASVAWLEGNTRVEEAEYGRALAQASRAGQPALMLRLALLRCAARVATLDDGPCPAQNDVARDAGPEEQAYENYLQGKPLSAAQRAALPAAHRALAVTALQPDEVAAALGKIDDPQSRLIAAGVLFRQGRVAPAVIDQAIDTASAQGWRRPLLAWLHVAQSRAQADGDSAAAAHLQRRIDTVTGKGAY